MGGATALVCRADVTRCRGHRLDRAVLRSSAGNLARHRGPHLHALTTGVDLAGTEPHRRGPLRRPTGSGLALPRGLSSEPLALGGSLRALHAAGRSRRAARRPAARRLPSPLRVAPRGHATRNHVASCRRLGAPRRDSVVVVSPAGVHPLATGRSRSRPSALHHRVTRGGRLQLVVGRGIPRPRSLAPLFSHRRQHPAREPHVVALQRVRRGGNVRSSDRRYRVRAAKALACRSSSPPGRYRQPRGGGRPVHARRPDAVGRDRRPATRTSAPHHWLSQHHQGRVALRRSRLPCWLAARRIDSPDFSAGPMVPWFLGIASPSSRRRRRRWPCWSGWPPGRPSRTTSTRRAR